MLLGVFCTLIFPTSPYVRVSLRLCLRSYQYSLIFTANDGEFLYFCVPVGLKHAALPMFICLTALPRFL